MKRIKRRLFLKLSMAIIATETLYIWDKLFETDIANRVAKHITVPYNNVKSVSFYNDFIVVNQPKEVAVFSSKCTHLGCKINKKEGEDLICPCHGSHFNLSGKAISGPAYKPLQKLAFQVDRLKKILTVKIG